MHRFFVDDQVIEKSRTIDFGTKVTDLDKLKDEKLKEFLENLSPEEFGNTRCSQPGWLLKLPREYKKCLIF